MLKCWEPLCHPYTQSSKNHHDRQVGKTNDLSPNLTKQVIIATHPKSSPAWVSPLQAERPPGPGQVYQAKLSHQTATTNDLSPEIYTNNNILHILTIDRILAKLIVTKWWTLKGLQGRSYQKFHNPDDYLGDIEAKDEFKRQENLVIVAKDAKPFKGLFGLLVPTDDEPVGDADEGVEKAVEEEPFPDTLEETGAPDAKDLENIAPAGGGNDV